MIEFVAHNMAPIMFLSLIVFMLLGYPVAFSLAANGLIFFFIGVELAPYSNEISLSWPLLYALPERFWGIMSNDTLLAIPFFTFMGIVLERSGMAEDLLDTIGQLFGPIRGGLAYAVILVGALLAATTGVVAASVIAMGLISLPIMLRYGYDRRIATGVIAASGTLAQIIPPSLVLIVLADQLGRSVGDMYKGALIPGLDPDRPLSRLCRADVDHPAEIHAGAAEGGTHAGVRRHVAVRRHGCHGRRYLRCDAVPERLGRQQCRHLGRCRRHRRHLCGGGRRQGARHRPDVAADAAGHHRADPATGADLPGAWNDLPRHRHTHRGRRHGRRRRAGHGRRQRAGCHST